MSNNARKNDNSTSSGHGALGMGGQPTDDPRDLESGHEDMTNDERTRSVPGAHGSGTVEGTGGGSANNVLGVGGDKAFDKLGQ